LSQKCLNAWNRFRKLDGVWLPPYIRFQRVWTIQIPRYSETSITGQVRLSKSRFSHFPDFRYPNLLSYTVL
jgi:hypothetical protein